MSRTAFRLIATVALTLAPGVAFAHPGHGADSSLLAGFWHPFSGIDHLLAMTAVGLLASQLGGRALWAVPTTFVAVMAFGGVLGADGVALPFVETAIALSVAVFGILILSGISLPVLAAMVLVGGFALFHGYAHGAEMPSGGALMAYGFGFVTATALLHSLGITLGLAISRINQPHRVVQACGAAIAIVGIGLTFGLV